jgi:hypothetical protein
MASAGPPPLQRNIGYTATLGGLNGISQTSSTPTQRWVHRNFGRPQWHQPDLSHSNATLGTPQLWEASMASARPPPPQRSLGYSATLGGFVLQGYLGMLFFFFENVTWACGFLKGYMGMFFFRECYLGMLFSKMLLGHAGCLVHGHGVFENVFEIGGLQDFMPKQNSRRCYVAMW